MDPVDQAKRADCYKLFSGCFCQPDKLLFKEETVLENLMQLLSDICPEAVEYAQEMAALFDEISEDELAVEYAALFMGPFQLKAPPYASVYLENSRRVMGDTTMQTLQSYREAGLQFDGEGPPDHIATELEFVSFLINEEMSAEHREDNEAVEVARNRQKEFIAQVLGKWVFDFCHAIEEKAGIKYYRALAVCLGMFMRCELENVIVDSA